MREHIEELCARAGGNKDRQKEKKKKKPRVRGKGRVNSVRAGGFDRGGSVAGLHVD